MARKERTSKGKTMLPNYFVFCEGDTEVVYIEMLRSHYRLPIHIIAKKTLLNITSSLVERCKSTYIQTKNDRTFLMYDLDVQTMLERLQQIPNTTLLCSNPCFELWLLLHYADIRSEISSSECVNRLTSFIPQYKKGTISPKDKLYLITNMSNAIGRAKIHESYANPSTTVYKLVEDLNALVQNPDKTAFLKN